MALKRTGGPPPVDSTSRAPRVSGGGRWEKCADWTGGSCDHCRGPGGVYWLLDPPDDDLPAAALCAACMKDAVDRDNQQ